MFHLKLFFLCLFVFFFLDMLWLGLIAKNMYQTAYAPWLRLTDGQLQPVWWAASLVYLLLALAVVVFVLPMADYGIGHSLFYGALFGLITYGVYDMTTYSIFKDWPLSVTLIDWVWGVVLCSSTATIAAWFSQFFD
ncbi:DUF2177 family protein [Legionella sp. CNM-4043-24]|uniref:DUF2177 family protein n=1 Tax=Legionella sp. CNM-4043-24 TaxID=3421646 RepID=UPI00403AD7A9